MLQLPHKTGAAIKALAALLLVAVAGMVSAQNVIDVWDTTDPDDPDLVAQIQTIQSAQTGQQHYNYSPASGEPACVNYGPRLANIWVHENTDATDDLTFGFIFNTRGNNYLSRNRATLAFRIVDSTSNPQVVQSDDPGEAVETPAGSDAFVGTYNYNDFNTDGMAVGGISGDKWTIIIDSVDFGNITNWYAAGGGVATNNICDISLSDVELEKGHEYRLTPEGNPPSGAPVDATLLAAVAGPDQTVEGGDFVTLDGTASSPLDEISFLWTQESGPAVILDDASSPTPTFQTPKVAGIITFSLTVTRDVTGEASEADLTNVIVFIIDADGDGVPDEDDAYPDDPTEWSDNDGNGIGDNLDAEIAGAFADCAADARNHGQYASCVAKYLNGLLADGRITDEQKDELQSIAAESDVGKPVKQNTGPSKKK